jgi:phosphatidylserine/phosphatidylglycerophosphate/cardiolipin synthase-like enzyme
MRRQKTTPGRSALAAAGLALLLPALATGGIETRFNSTERLEKYVKEAFSEAVARAKDGKPATIDIMIFSFTSPSLSDSLLRIARDYPAVKIRIIANLSQLFREPTSVVPDIEGIASGKVEAYRTVADRRKAFIKDPAEHTLAVDSELKQIISEDRQRPLPNVELKYKWFPAFSWDPALGRADYDHFHPKASLLHHKVAIIDGETLVTGSYNWSNYAETKNLENLMIVRGPENRTLVSDFEAEFEAMWNDASLTKTSAECRTLKDAICAGIDREHANEPGTKPPDLKAPAMKTGD